MVAYGIKYHIRGQERTKDILIDAKDSKSAKRKIGKKNGYKDGRMVVIDECRIIGYY